MTLTWCTPLTETLRYSERGTTRLKSLLSTLLCGCQISHIALEGFRGSWQLVIRLGRATASPYSGNAKDAVVFMCCLSPGRTVDDRLSG